MLRSIEDEVGQDPQYCPMSLRRPDTEVGLKGPVLRDVAGVRAEHRRQVSVSSAIFLYLHCSLLIGVIRCRFARNGYRGRSPARQLCGDARL